MDPEQIRVEREDVSSGNDHQPLLLDQTGAVAVRSTAPKPETPSFEIQRNRSMSFPGGPVNRNVFEGVQNVQQRSTRVLGIYILYGLLEVIVSIVILSINWNKPCDQPLRYFVLFFSGRFMLGIPIHMYRFRFPEAAERIKRMANWIDLLFLGWFIVGQIWTFQADTCRDTASSLYYYSFALILFTYFVMLLPVVIILAVCLCMPCVLIVLRLLAEPEGADEGQINELPTRAWSNENPTDQCTICMADYEEGEILRKLPCDHEFHTQCVDRWLPINKTCPLCRHDILQPLVPEHDGDGNIHMAQV